MSWPILMIFLDSVKRNMLHELYIKKMVHMSGGRTFLNDAWIKDSFECS